MTVGRLAQRTGLSHKVIRELEGRGLIYSAGRSEANYRLFDENALWCVGAIDQLRSLGLTLAEIEQLAASHLEHPGRHTGPQLARLLDRSQERTSARLQSLRLTLERIEDFRAANPELLAGAPAVDPASADPCRAAH
jgi:MerR family copper efflux transcriptional regulator